MNRTQQTINGTRAPRARRLALMCAAPVWSIAIFGGPSVMNASAQEATAQEASDEIVVTARRREEGVQDTPIAVSAFSGSRLEDLGVTHSSDLDQVTANLTINGGFAASNPQIFVRGVGRGDYNDNAQATVGTYLDDVFLSAPAGKLLQMYDLESVQVLKGPQGTLFGRNNTAGALLISSRRPDGETDGYVRGAMGDFGLREIEAAGSFPITEGLSARLSGQTRQTDGYGELINASGQQIGDLGGVDEYALRGILRYQGGPWDATLTLSAANADNERPPTMSRPYPGATDAAGFTPFDASNVHQNQNNFREIEDVSAHGVFLNVDYDFGAATLTSVTAFWNAERFITLDVDHSPLSTVHASRDAESEQWSQELRLASNGSGPFQWVAGVYYLAEQQDVRNLFGFFAPTAQPFLFQNYTNDTETAAIFAEGIWSFGERWSLTAGLRETYDQRDFAISLDPLLAGPGAETALQNDWTEPSWRVILDYQATPDAMLYASVSRSFQGGGYNGGAFSLPEVGAGFRPEFLTAYELGVKSEWFNSRLVLNAALFHYDYEDPQVFTIASGLVGGSTVGIVQTITNAEGATLDGLDLDMRARLTDDLTFTLGLGLVRSEYEGLLIADSLGTIVSGDGNSLINAPETDLSAGLDYDIHVGEGVLTAHVDYSYTGRRYFDITERDQFSGSPYSLVNARLTYASPDENWRVSLFGRNLTDEENLVFQADLSATLGLIEEIYGPPRTYGLELTYNWR